MNLLNKNDSIPFSEGDFVQLFGSIYINIYWTSHLSHNPQIDTADNVFQVIHCVMLLEMPAKFLFLYILSKAYLVRIMTVWVYNFKKDDLKIYDLKK
jgi:hypothetical protein